MAASNIAPDLTGCFVEDRYELVEMLGSGSFGVVYKAIDLDDSDGRVVAVKVISKADWNDDELSQIQHEVALHSIVADNQGIVTLIDAFDDARYCYIVLELCRGGDLFEQIMYKKSYVGNDERLRAAFLSLVDAVQACHDAGIAHRDLKPENVLTNEDGSECYLADFGLATDEPIVWEHGVGSSLYKSPECIGEMIGWKSYDPYLSDLWALGIILLNMITGENLWLKATSGDADFCRFLSDPDFLFDAYPMSTGAQAIIQGLLQLDPAHRISLDTLRQAVLSLDTFFRPSSQFARDAILEHEHTTTGFAAETSSASASESESGYEAEAEYEYESMTTRASAFDIPCAALEPDVRIARDCSAGSAVDSYSPSPSSSWSRSYSSLCASCVASFEGYMPTPEDTIAPKADLMWDQGHHKDAWGYESWQPGEIARMIMAQYSHRRVQYYDVF